MLWVPFFTFLLFSPALQAQETLPDQSRRQVRQYIENIRQDNNVAINLWALAEVNRDQPELQRFTNSHIEQSSIESSALQVFRDTTLSYTSRLRRLSFLARSPVLLITYLLEEQDPIQLQTAIQKYETVIGYPESGGVDYKELVRSILRQEPVTTEILSADQFHPLHFFFFFDNTLVRNKTFSSDYLNQAADTWDKSGLLRSQTLGQSFYRLTLFRIHYLLDQYTKIDPLYRPMISDPNFPVSARQLNIFRMLDYSMYRLGYYNRSINITRSYSLPLANHLNQKKLALKLQVDLGATLYTIGKIEDSKQINLELQKKFNNNISISEGRVYNNLAINYWKSGEFDNFLNLEFKALQEGEKENNYEVQQKALRNLFTHYRVNKDFSSAKQYLKSAKKLAFRENNKQDLARLSYFEGQLYRDTKSNYELAIASFDTALSLISFDNYYISYQDILAEKGKLFEKQEKYQEAKDIYRRVLQKAQERNDPRNSLYAAFSKANVHLQIDEVDSARVMLDTLSTKNLDALDFYQLVKARTVQARYFNQTDQPHKGTEILQPVIEQIVKRSRSSGDLETGFWQIEPEYLNAFEAYANLLIEHGKPEQAVEVLDRLKTINDAALYQNPLVRSKVLNEEELSRYKRLTENLDALRKQLLTASGEEHAELQQQIDEKSAQKNVLDHKITANANPEPIAVNYIQRRMDAYQRVLHITELNDTYYLAVISRTGVNYSKIPITQDLRSHFEETIKQLAAGTTDLKNLYPITHLLKVDALPDHVNKLTIIPDSYLYQLPLDILPISSPAHGQSYGDAVYLIERFRTNYMTSLNDFKTTASNETDHAYSYAGFGVSSFGEDRKALVPLPQAQAEIKNISDQLTALNHKKSFINDAATEQAFRESAPNARILHLATHSEVSGRDPMFSSIYLSRGQRNSESKFPGRIFAYELFELNLRNELIMLNSCESGSGSYLQGTGVVGMSRALRYAGAQSLILNLWSVNDMMASEFAVQFYEGINNGKTKSEALRDAKLHFLKTKNANPHYWGSYMLLGDEQAIVQPNQFTNNMVAASFLIFFFSLAIASSVIEITRRRKRRQGNNG